MKTNRDPLDRLLQAAARAPQPATREAVFAVEARVLAEWRSAREGDDSALLVFWLRRAMACACVLLALSAAWNVGSGPRRTGDEMSFTDSALQIALNRP